MSHAVLVRQMPAYVSLCRPFTNMDRVVVLISDQDGDLHSTQSSTMRKSIQPTDSIGVNTGGLQAETEEEEGNGQRDEVWRERRGSFHRHETRRGKRLPLREARE